MGISIWPTQRWPVGIDQSINSTADKISSIIQVSLLKTSGTLYKIGQTKY